MIVYMHVYCICECYVDRTYEEAVKKLDLARSDWELHMFEYCKVFYFISDSWLRARAASDLMVVDVLALIILMITMMMIIIIIIIMFMESQK